MQWYFKILMMILICLPASAAETIPLVRDKADPVISPRVIKYIQSDTSGKPVPVWIFLTDKGFRDADELPARLQSVQLSPRTLRRRAKVMTADCMDFRDLPVNPEYLGQLQSAGLTVRTGSKWLNAISGQVPPELLPALAQFPFVREIQLLAAHHHSDPEAPAVRSGLVFGTQGIYNYGLSEFQLQQIHVPDVHAWGYTGNGVLICITDTGFMTEHEAFAQLDILAEYDFIHHDNNTRNDSTQDSDHQHDHGSKVLSVLGGASPGELYGPAFGATYLLAKTEDLINEDVIEEDYWIRALEWADSLGADIVNASIGYLDWYTYADLDGNTSPMTIAADIAAGRGILVCTSVGNERNNAWHYLTVPADGDSVVAVGGVDNKGLITIYSSAGPTADGRTKPEVVGPASGVRMIDVTDPQGYTTGSGTSYASPLVAGVCALLLEAHPKWTPMQVREALINTASRADNPDNLYGWGLVDALAAIEYQLRGDVNGDDCIDEQDVSLTANLCFDATAVSEAVFRSADQDRNGTINILDVLQLIQTLPSQFVQ